MTDARETWLQLTAVDIKILELFDYLERVGGAVFPSQKWLAEKLRVSERTIRRGVAHLKLLGVIAVQPRRCRDRRGQVHSHSNVYRVLGLAGAFVRGLFARITKRPNPPRVPSQKKKKTFSEPFPLEKTELRPETLLKMPLLGVWMARDYTAIKS